MIIALVFRMELNYIYNSTYVASIKQLSCENRIRQQMNITTRAAANEIFQRKCFKYDVLILSHFDESYI